ncbi:MAG: 2,3-bisphosphoglycerate-independent phosphoglycerate mutase [Cryomorphaceae bacterium]
MNRKVALVILDGWGFGDGSKADAVASADTPFFDGLMQRAPHNTLKTFGEHVGLPEGQMGNSEVGHLNIGAGRIVYQDLVKVNRAVATGVLKENPAIQNAIAYAKESNVAIHLMGLVSEGGVHSHQDHLHALIDLLDDAGLDKVFVHAFTDGRDTAPKNAVECIGRLVNHTQGKNAKLVSMIGRYYAMDRDQRWERIKLAYDLLVNGKGNPTNNFQQSCKNLYEEGISDEFFTSQIIADRSGRIRAEDVVICFNFRTDRCRQITTALTQQDFPDFGMTKLPLHYTTMTRYDEKYENVNVVFDKDNLKNTVGEVVASAGRTQLRIAETEKYPHVTFFFSGGREAAFEGETREMVNSPKVATYDLQPEMSAPEVTERVIQSIDKEQPDFICLNFANPDMVGHTGVYNAIIQAVETIDACLRQVVEAGKVAGYDFVIIADHGNADIAFLPDGTPHTSHTLNPVPCIVMSSQVAKVNQGILADVAPSILKLMHIDQPKEMTGTPLF